MKLQCITLFVMLKQFTWYCTFNVYSPSNAQNVPVDYFPEVDYPIDIIEATKPFYINSSGSNVLLSAFTDDVQKSFKEISNKQNTESHKERMALGHMLDREVNPSTTNETKIPNTSNDIIVDSSETCDQEIGKEEYNITRFDSKEIDALEVCSSENTCDLDINSTSAKNSTSAEYLDNVDNDEFEWILSTVYSKALEDTVKDSVPIDESEIEQYKTDNITSTWNKSLQDSDETNSSN